MFDTILVPTDGSEGMGRVLDHAAGLATAHDAAVHAVYAVHTASYANLPMETSWESLGTVLSEEGEAALAAAERRLDAESVETELLEGPPSREILTYAERAGCDLVVMGTHGRGGLNRLLLGSVAERVVRSAEIPVMTVRLGEAEIEDDETTAEGDRITADPSVTQALE